MSKIIGQQLEDLAAQYLADHNVKIIQRNFSCKMGEIDLIGWLDDILIFIEVRYRYSHEFGHPLETVTRYKQQKLKRTSYYYLQRFKNSPPFCRFDVLSAIGPTSNLDWEWIPDAFQVQ